MQFSVEDTNRSGSHTIAQRWGYISKPIIQKSLQVTVQNSTKNISNI
uniref:Uncharacterized protein n=1 Tax=Anguilla anguilla TaxID=7936 RepID=A0A0E9UQJ0_ANGAN